MNHEEYLAEILESDPEFKKQWEEDEPEREILFAVARLMRNDQGLTQAELSERIGVKQGELSKLESGKGNPTLSTMKKLAKGLGMRLELKFVPLK